MHKTGFLLIFLILGFILDHIFGSKQHKCLCPIKIGLISLAILCCSGKDKSFTSKLIMCFKGRTNTFVVFQNFCRGFINNDSFTGI